MSVEFCDTNILVYAHDLGAGPKRTRAQQLVRALWLSGDGAVSIQVLQELFVTLTRKLRSPLSPSDARTIISYLGSWQVVAPTHQEVLAAIDASLRWQISFWDAMIVVAAGRAGAEVIWSEDLNDGQDFGGIVVRNPFLAPVS
jgi:predicted nucleic acid-binding protein